MNWIIETPPLFTKKMAVTYLGCLLLLLGNVLPWPCPRGYSARDCTPLITFHLNDSWLGVALTACLLLLPVIIVLLKPPLKVASWWATWLLIFLLMVRKLYAIDFGGPTPGYLPLVSINPSMGIQSAQAVPLSLVTYWLFIRPQSLQKAWRALAWLSLIALTAVTAFWLAFGAIALQQVQNDPFYFYDPKVSGVGPLVILVGCGVLFGTMRAKDRATASAEAPQPE